MDISLPLQNLIKQAQDIAVSGSTKYFKLSATIITPVAHVPMYVPTGFKCTSDFAGLRSDTFALHGQLQPGVYLKQVLPYKDNLRVEVVQQFGDYQVVRTFRANPTTNVDPHMVGMSTKTSNVSGMDELNLMGFDLQLLELGYAILRYLPIGNVALMADVGSVLKHELITAGEQINLTGADAFRGVDMPEAPDNTRVYTHIEYRDGTRLMDLGTYLQNDDSYGIYSKGLGLFYRKGMFYVYPLFKMGRYDTAKTVMDIFRLPQDAVPTIETSYTVNGSHLYVLATGDVKHVSNADINRQNNGVGKRIINPDALVGEAGHYYKNGSALTTRPDSINEYKTFNRDSGEQLSNFEQHPSMNVFKHLSESAFNDGELLTITWDRCDSRLVIPGMPCKYYYTKDNINLVIREGVILHCESEYQMNTPGDPQPVFKESCKLTIFLTKDSTSTTDSPS